MKFMFKMIAVTLLIQINLSAGAKTEKLCPPNLDFSELQEDLDAYIKSFPDEAQSVEKRRVGIVKNFKKMVIKVILRTPYEGRIYLNGKSYEGKISKAEDSGLTVAIGDKEKILKWEEINPRQYSDIFIAEAVRKAESLTPDKRENSDETFKKAGNYYFALAVFYDWYNNPAASKLFRKKATVLNPDLKSDIEKMWPVQEVSKKNAE